MQLNVNVCVNVCVKGGKNGHTENHEGMHLFNIILNAQ